MYKKSKNLESKCLLWYINIRLAKSTEGVLQTMNGKFFDLKKEKQDRMINAALKVFALHGYRRASTDDIVREARISKGLLFHYFESKVGLYTFIYDYSVRYMSLELKNAVSPNEHNMFAIIKQTEYAKMLALRNYPYMQQFLNQSMSEDVNEALLAIEYKRNDILDIYEAIDAQADYGLLPKNVDGEKIYKMITFTINGLMTERFFDASFQPEMLYEEIASYIDMIQNMVTAIPV